MGHYYNYGTAYQYYQYEQPVHEENVRTEKDKEESILWFKETIEKPYLYYKKLFSEYENIRDFNQILELELNKENKNWEIIDFIVQIICKDEDSYDPNCPLDTSHYVVREYLFGDIEIKCISKELGSLLINSVLEQGTYSEEGCKRLVAYYRLFNSECNMHSFLKISFEKAINAIVQGGFSSIAAEFLRETEDYESEDINKIFENFGLVRIFEKKSAIDK